MWVKICGLHDVDSARSIADLGPDAIGLNFHPQSPRFVDVRMAERIVRAIPSEVEPIALFVNRDPDDMLEIAVQLRISTIQLHGDEPPAVAASLAQSGLQVIRAVRVDESTIPALAATVQDHKDIPLRAVLVDARVAGQFGGSGRTAPWKLIADAWRPDWPPLILAGGLNPENVADAIAVTHPWGVDTASGVESSPGLKDVALARRFINAARGT